MRIVATSQIRYHRTPTVIPEQQPGAGAFEPAQAPAKKIRLLKTTLLKRNLPLEHCYSAGA